MPKSKKPMTLTFDQINAYKVAYDKPFTKKKLFWYFTKPVAMVGLFSYMLFMNLWMPVILCILTVLYIWRKMLPIEVKRDYARKSFEARNNFIMSASQVLSNEDINLLDALDVVSSEAGGEFSIELIELITNLRVESNEPHEAFKNFSSKYEVDKVFVSFVEQLETIYKCGIPNTETIDNLVTMHNDLRARTESFIDEKDSYRTGFVTVGGLISMFVIIPFAVLSIADYVPTLLAQIINCIFVFMLFRHIDKNFVERYYDDSVMELRLSK